MGTFAVVMGRIFLTPGATVHMCEKIEETRKQFVTTLNYIRLLNLSNQPTSLKTLSIMNTQWNIYNGVRRFNVRNVCTDLYHHGLLLTWVLPQQSGQAFNDSDAVNILWETLLDSWILFLNKKDQNQLFLSVTIVIITAAQKLDIFF